MLFSIPVLPTMAERWWGPEASYQEQNKLGLGMWSSISSAKQKGLGHKLRRKGDSNSNLEVLKW